MRRFTSRFSRGCALGLAGLIALSPATLATPLADTAADTVYGTAADTSAQSPRPALHQAAPGSATTLAQARRAAGVTTGKPYPYNNPHNFMIPDASAYKDFPEIRTPGCTLTPQHPNPVILVHGTWANAEKWEQLAPVLQKAGYCVWAMNYGYDPTNPFYGDPSKGQFAAADPYSGSIELNNYVNKVLRLTGAKKVDLIGHSQAGFMFHLWMHDFRGNERTARVITLGGTNHGTTMMGVNTLVKPLWKYPQATSALQTVLSKAAVAQVVGSPAVTYVNSLPDTMPGVHYTVITSENDTTSTPYYRGFLEAGPGAKVSNVVVQKVCRVDHLIGHNDLTTDPISFALILRGLAGKPVTCVGTPWSL